MNATRTQTGTAAHEPRVSVAIPTYRRPGELRRAVASVLAGTLLPAELLVTYRADDTETETVLLELERMAVSREVRFRALSVTKPGHLPPIAAIRAAVQTPWVAIVDDDVTVDHGWLAALAVHFGEVGVGVLGGRVVERGIPEVHEAGLRGRINRWGLAGPTIAHLAASEPLEVDTVTEGNWAWRSELLRSIDLDPELNRYDAAMYGLDLTLQAQALGWRVLYEPRAVLVHHAAPRAPEYERTAVVQRAAAYAYNYTRILWRRRLRGIWRLLFLVWWLPLGDPGAPGPLRWLAGGVQRRRIAPATRAKLAALVGLLLGRKGRERSTFAGNDRARRGSATMT